MHEGEARRRPARRRKSCTRVEVAPDGPHPRGSLATYRVQRLSRLGHPARGLGDHLVARHPRPGGPVRRRHPRARPRAPRQLKSQSHAPRAFPSPPLHACAHPDREAGSPQCPPWRAADLDQAGRPDRPDGWRQQDPQAGVPGGRGAGPGRRHAHHPGRGPVQPLPPDPGRRRARGAQVPPGAGAAGSRQLPPRRQRQQLPVRPLGRRGGHRSRRRD